MNSKLACLEDDRRSMRSELAIEATITARPALNVAATVLNVSAHGAMAYVATRLAPGRAVTLTMPRLEARKGQIVWWREGHVGIAFADVLTVSELQRAVGD